nr:EAL domain-containing protein [Deltaproteobacteria bacterium]
MNTYIARQPIFSRDKKIYAYELLFRDGMKDFFPDIDGSSATSRVLSSAFFSSDIKQITSGKKAFINFNRDLINQRIPQLFPSQVTIVEILEDVEPDGLFIENCRALSSKGYKIALDDFQYRRELDALIPIADIIKMDFQNTDPETLEQYVEMFSRKGYTLLAEKVETVEEFRKACSMGFTYFQGYFFSKPELVRETEIPALKMNLIQIMSEAGNDEFRINEMERLIERDVGIS